MSADLFGSAEPTREEPRVLTVSELTRAVRATLEDQIGAVWVEGEISNYRKQPSGHQYFTLKDEQSQVACVWFARGGLRLKQTALADGMHVQVRGALTVYEARGQYQLNVQAVQAAGAGLLQAKFEALKRKLEAEGLFDSARKRPLPRFPGTIGLVTSPTGAALRDMLNILARRAPWVRVVISPVRVQGQGAAQEIATAVAELNDLIARGVLPIDVIVVGRGGGSIEDLWEFNEEAVARAIVQSVVPVVSAVGHEIDFTIADFAADLRAATPSAAAELIVPDGEALRRYVVDARSRLQRAAGGLLLQERNRLAYLSRVASPQALLRTLREYAQRVDMAGEVLRRTIQERRRTCERQLVDLRARLREHLPDQQLALSRHSLSTLTSRVGNCARAQVLKQKQRFAHVEALLKALSPEATLARGFSITSIRGGAIIRSVSQVAPQTKLTTRFKDGSVNSVAE
ncbi:MAG: exodeoxyribonuclease VII large subunit [Chthoniobacter sp.]|uniref:exodeoxyribonuclease VII large subunit n=1 Tax=Chthoniobacter sp. TaxID=2510640 RepID=UPI0032A53EF5